MKDEILTRRAFFKKAAQKTLPILMGASALSSVISCVKNDDELMSALDREEVENTGCTESSCSLNCSAYCKESSNGSGSGCTGASCSYNCSAYCKDTANGSGGGCTGASCSSNCGSQCKTDCKIGCGQECYRSCGGSCDKDCAVGCLGQCVGYGKATTCYASTCYGTCRYHCSKTCNDFCYKTCANIGTA